MTPPHQDGGVADSVDEMLLDNDCLSARSIPSYNQGESPRRQNPNISPLVPVLTIPIEGREGSGSVQTSWAGFSPWSNSNVMLAQENPASEISDISASDTITVQGETRERSDVTGSAHGPANTSRSLEKRAWTDVPGLPLMFGENPQKPIDISSDSSSEVYSTTSSNSQIILEQVDPAIHKRLDLQRHDNSQEQKLEFTTPRMNDKSTPAAVTVKGTLLEPIQKQKRQSYARAPNLMPQPKTMIPIEARDAMGVPTVKVTGLMGNLAAVSKVSKQPEKSAKSLLSPVQGTTGGSSLADEELIWRKFVFGDSLNYEKSADDDEPKKSPKRIGPASNESSLLTTLSESPGRSSLSAQASSASVAAHRLGSAHTSRDPLQKKLAATISYTDSDISLSPLQAEASLPATDETSQQAALSSIIAHASASSSPSRSHQLAPSLSADELAMEPQKPTFYFRKPSRYIGAQPNGSAAVHLGQRQKVRSKE